MAFPEPLVAGDLSVAAETGTPMRVRFTGKATLRNAPAELAPWMGELLAEAGKRGAIELRFEKLQHANSSSILAVVQLARQLLEKRLKVRIRYDARQRWQKFTFEGLTGLDPGGELLELAGGD